MSTTSFEIKHPGTRHGIVVMAGGLSGPRRRAVVCDAYEIAASLPVGDVGDPGFWAICVGIAALRVSPAAVQRVVGMRGDRHVVMFVERGRMLQARPEWPLVRLSDAGELLDLRGPRALRLGPGDAELAAYAAEHGLPDFAVERLHSMFAQGVLQWSPEAPRPGHRRGIVRAT